MYQTGGPLNCNALWAYMEFSFKRSAFRVRVDSSGRIVLPSELRQMLGIKTDSDLLLSSDARGIYLRNFEQAVKCVQRAFAPYCVPGESVVEELIKDREEEARRECDD
jgi:AbrB family looped-hinge helix DNA binding protein